MNLAWKPNWAETQQQYINWWNHAGMIVGAWPPPRANAPHESASTPEKPVDLNRYFTEPDFRAAVEHQRLSQGYFGGDILPVAETDIGPGSLALYLGSEPGISRETVWFNPCLTGIDQPIRFDPANRWWQITRSTLIACREKGRGKYLVGCPDLVENLDILASLRGVETLMMDLVECPDHVLARLEELNQAWFEVFTQIFQEIGLEDGSSVFGAFRLWAPGKMAKVQCDASAMLSPRMFRRFVIPFLSRQCSWLDHSLYHLDGHQALVHLDSLLEIEHLDAIEWTPDPAVPSGGSPTWYDLYRKILAKGKSVQIVGVKLDECKPLLDAIGPRGVYLFAAAAHEDEYEAFLRVAEPYRI